MGDCNEDLNQTDDEEIILRDEVFRRGDRGCFLRAGRTSNSCLWHLLLRLSFPAGVRQPGRSPKIRRGGSRWISRSWRSYCGSLDARERTMLETPIIVVLVLLAIVAVLWWVYRW